MISLMKVFGKSSKISSGVITTSSETKDAIVCVSILSQKLSESWTMCDCMLSHFSLVWLFATLWTVAHQVLLSMRLYRQVYWSELSCPPLGDLPISSQFVFKVLYSRASACNVEDLDSIPGLGQSPGKVNGYPSRILAWWIPWTEEPGGLQSLGSQTVGHDCCCCCC